MILKVLSLILGLATVSFAPLLITLLSKLLTTIGRRYPLFGDVASIVGFIIVGAFLLLQSFVFAIFYYDILIGKHLLW
jgi:hypothetical protein